MAALKWIVVVISGLGAAGALGLGFIEGGATQAPPPAVTLSPLSVRPLPTFLAPSRALSAPDTTPAQPTDATMPMKPPEKQPEKQPEASAKPGELASKPKPPPQPVGEGVLNLRASNTADVYVDGKKVGSSPLLGFKVKAGEHRVRFDCYDAAGNAIAGPMKTVAVKPDEEQDMEFTCPEPE